MADDTAAPSAPAGPIDLPSIQAAIAALGLQQPAAPQPAPVDRSVVSLLGEALGGGDTGMSPAEREAAGTRALLNFGTNMMAASGPSVMPRSFGQIFGQGVGGAEQSLASSEEVSAARLAAQQAYQEKQQELRINALREAIPLLQMQQLSAAKKALLGGGGAPGTSIAAAAGPGTYEGSIAASEGTTPSTTSTSAGIGGFTEGTWSDYVKANPDLFKGMTPEQILAARSNPAIATPAITWLAQRNAAQLSTAGVQPSGPSLAVAHKLGPTAAAAVMQAPENTPLVDVLTASIGKDEAAAYLKANPSFAGQTVGGYRSQWANVPDPGFLKPATAATPQGAPAPAPTATAPAAKPGTPALPVPPVPPVITDQPAGGAQVAGPGAPTTARVGAVSPAVPGDVNAIIRGMTGAGADQTTLAPPGAPAPPVAPAPAVVAGPGAPPAPEVLPLADAMAKAKATGQPVLFQGGNGAAIKPDGTINMSSAAPPPTPPAPDRVPSSFTYTRQPLPPDIQQRIDNPVPPDQLKRLNDGISTAMTPEALQAAQNAKDTAIAKARTDAITQGETWQQANAKQMQEVWQKQLDIQQANDLKQRDIDQANATAAATRQQEITMEGLRNRDVQINSQRDQVVKDDSAKLGAMRTDADNAEGTIKQLQMLRSVEADMPTSGSTFFNNHPEMLSYFANNLGLSEDAVKRLNSQDMFQRVLKNLGTQMSQKAAVGPGTARSAEITQNMAALPDLATDHNGRLQMMGFIQNMAQDQINRANEAEDYYYRTPNPNKDLNLNQSLYKFPQWYEQQHPDIIPRAPATGATAGWLRQNVQPGMIFEAPIPQLDPLTRQPKLNANGRPIVKYERQVRGEDE